MQNFILSPPNFLTNYWQSSAGILKNDGMNVLASATSPTMS